VKNLRRKMTRSKKIEELLEFWLDYADLGELEQYAEDARRLIYDAMAKEEIDAAYTAMQESKNNENRN
jgi:hypothetical protein